MAPSFKLGNLDEKELAMFNLERELFWREEHPELSFKNLSSDFIIKCTKEKKIWFRDLRKKKGEEGWSTLHHPKFGELPHPWQLRLCEDPHTEIRIPKYYNPDTRETQRRDPRLGKNFIEKLNSLADQSRKEDIRKIPKSLRPSIKLDIAGSRKKADPKKELGRDYHHQPIGKINERRRYEIVHTIDAGDGSMGAMNGGVFVVKMKNKPQLFVEKRFQKDKAMHALAKKEITMLQKLFHSAISFYTDGFWTATDASLYVEFCDRGDLKDIIRAFEKKGKDKNELITVPEGFIWHAFICLLDALTYLLLGRGPMDTNACDYSNHQKEPGWVPVLHRDLKPDNILLRSRSEPSSSKYFYCIISDFGLACDDLPRNHPDCDSAQRSGGICGTCSYFAPELLYNPYPRKGTDEEDDFPQGERHSAQSDLWALGATIHNLATPSLNSHLNPRPAHVMNSSIWLNGLQSRKLPFPRIADEYTDELNDMIRLCGERNKNRRPSAPVMLEMAVAAGIRAGFDRVETHDPLPGWSTRVHSYHSNKARPSE